MTRRPRHRRRRSACLILAAASAVLPSARALADDFWTGLGDGVSWSDPNNWSAGVPGNGDSASIITTGSTAVAVNYDYTASPITLAALTLDLTAGSPSATNTFNLSANTLTTTAETIGLNGSGTFNQSAGLNDTITLNLAANPNSAGFYTQTGGTTNITGNTYIGGSSAGAGGQGVLIVNNTASFSTSGTLKAWNTPGSQINLNGGSITAKTLDISGNSSLLNWTSGALTITGASTAGLVVDSVAAPSVGPSLLLRGNQSLAATNVEYIGYSGTGSITQTAGSNSVGSSQATGNLYLGYQANSTGTYTMSGGTLNVTNPGLRNSTPGDEYIGYNGAAIFCQTGGTNTISNYGTLYVNGASALYELSGTASLVVNSSGSNASGSPGEYIGFGSGPGGGTFNQSGGTNTIGPSAGEIDVGGSSGTYMLSGGTLSIPAGPFAVGDGGVGYFNQSGGTNTPGVVLALAFATPGQGGTGTYSLSGGVVTTPCEIVGGITRGFFNQTGGSNSVTSLYVAGNVVARSVSGSEGGTGDYTLSGTGVLNATEEDIGSAGLHYSLPCIGTFTQSAGTNSLGTTGQLSLGVLCTTASAAKASATGTYTLSGSGSLVSGAQVIGAGGVGNFIQTGGTNSVQGAGNLYLGGGPPPLSFVSAGLTISGGTGTYSLSGTSSTLMVPYANECIGYTGRGAFTQCGGLNTISADNLFVGFSSGSSGSFAMTGGATNITGSAYIGGSSSASGGTGVLTVSGSGAFTTTGTLKAWNTTGTQIDIYGGIVSAGSLDTSGNPGLLHWTTGTLNITGAGGLTVSATGPFGNSLSLPTGQTLGVSNTLAIASTSTLSITGGSVTASATSNNGSIHHSSGTAAFGALSGAGMLQVGGSTGSPAVASAVSVSQSAVTVNSTGVLQILQNIPGVTSSIGSLVINGGGQIDITNNGLLLNETNNPLSQVTAWIQSQSITSSLVNGPNSQASRAIGYGDSSEDPLTIPAGDVEVKYVPFGDTNLDGVVDITDLTRAINNLGLSPGYYGGDVANQGMVNITDIADIINDLGATLNSSGTSDPAIMMQTQDGSVPEPASLGLLTAGGLGLLARRRRGRALCGS